MPGFLRRPLILIRRLYRTLWMRVSLLALLSFVAAGLAALAEGLLPAQLAARIGPDAVMPVLTILATAMLAVSTFSLNIMVSAHRTAAGNATPRIHRLLLADTTTQNVLATFIGAFVYALSAIILFRIGLYPPDAAFVVMAVTILVVVLVVVAILRWIEHLSRLGSLDDSMQIAAAQAEAGLAMLERKPGLGANPLTDATVLPMELTPVSASASGYVQIVDVAGIEACLEGGACAYVARAPGHHVLRGEPLVAVSGHLGDEARAQIAAAFVLGDQRSVEQDPEFGLLMLSEISSRALSPGVNDPGTAIEVITRLETLLWDYATRDITPDPVRCPRVFLPVPSSERLIEASFAATARDGAGTIEVALQLRQALLALSRAPDDGIAKAAGAMARYALDHARGALKLDADRTRLSETRS